MIKNWIKAFRLRTLPLSFSLIIVGSTIAWQRGIFAYDIFLLALLTTLFLQILSNISNDYGDAVSGVDFANRVGPERMVQSGAITMSKMRKAIVVFSILSLIAGVALLYVAFPRLQASGFALMLIIGIMAIAAAIGYTIGKKPYGYIGLGDLSVFVFFGLVGVGGSYVLYEGALTWPILLPASSIGLLSVAVLNMNNMRDMHSDSISGKRTLVVRIGVDWARRYQIAVIVLAFVLMSIYVACFGTGFQWLFALSLPIFIKNIVAVATVKDLRQLDAHLKLVSMGTLILSLLFAVGTLI